MPLGRVLAAFVLAAVSLSLAFIGGYMWVWPAYRPASLVLALLAIDFALFALGVAQDDGRARNGKGKESN